jgi:predicted dehydrogenase
MEKTNSTRRHFLKNAAILTGSAIVAPTILTQCAKGANDRIMMAHIGVGSMGKTTLQRWFMPLTSAYAVAACDTFLDRRTSVAQYVNRTYKEKNIKAPECKAYLDFNEILERKDIDCVNITTPDHWHVLAAIKAVRAGKHVMVAKPLGLSYPDFKILEKELKAHDMRFHYGTQQRAMSHMKLAISLIKEGKIGEVERVDVWAPGKNNVPSPQCNEVPVPSDFDYERWTGPARMNPYCPDRVTNNGSWFQNDYSIGFLAGWGAHPLDIMVMGIKEQLAGKYTCEGTGNIWEPGGMYNNIVSWDLNYEYESGVKLHFMSNDIAEKKNAWNYLKLKDNNNTTFFGSKGWIAVGRTSAESNIPELNEKLNAFPKNDQGWIKEDGWKMGQMYVDVVKGTTKETCPLDEAIMSDCLSHMGDIAIRTGRKITWNPVVGEVVGDPDANNLFRRENRSPYNI